MAKAKFETIEVTLYAKDQKAGVLTIEKAKEMLGWEEEAEGKKPFEKDFLFKDLNGKKVRLNFNDTNRPFRMSLAKRYMSEVLRKKWHLNGETLIFDRTGKVQDGQHRLVGLIFAEQERQKNKDHWKQYGWSGPVNVETIVVTGISEKDDVANSIGGGQKRSLGDVIFRTEDFGQIPDREQQKLSNCLAGAARLAWIRCGGMTVSDAKHFPHSEAIEFLDNHPKLAEFVQFIQTEEGGSGAEGRKISSYITLNYAAGLLYLMATAKTDYDKWVEKGTEALDYSLEDKAKEFWMLFASGGGSGSDDPIVAVRKLLLNMDAGAGSARDEIVATVINAWNAWIDGKKAGGKDLKPKKIKSEAGKMVLAAMPRIGGLDVDQPEPEIEEDEKDEETHEDEEGEDTPKKKAVKKGGKPVKKAAKKKAVKKTGKGWKAGEWCWVNDGSSEPWKGKITSVDGNDVILDVDGEEFAAEINQLSADKPE